MSRAIRRQGPALVVAAVALMAALGGTVYAAGKINGHAIKARSLPGNRLVPKSLPGNRLALRSVPANRLKPGSFSSGDLAAGSVQGDRLAPGSVTGLQVDVSTLGQVPSAFHAEAAESAKDAETALNAANAENANRVNGYEAGCRGGTVLFAGSCWQTSANPTAVTPANAASACANEGGELPDPLLLVAFSQQPGISISSGDEWTSDLTNLSGPNSYAVVTVLSTGEVSFAAFNVTKNFRCVLPLLS